MRTKILLHFVIIKKLIFQLPYNWHNSNCCYFFMTSCTCERTFSKLRIIKAKLRSSTMTQQRVLDGILTMLVEQVSAYNINVDKIIEQFKTLTPIVLFCNFYNFGSNLYIFLNPYKYIVSTTNIYQSWWFLSLKNIAQ